MIMKNLKVFISLLFLLLCTHVFSQDKITRLNGEEIQAQVLEIKTEIITYKKISNLTGPTYEILKSEVHKIRFKNGSEEIINALVKDGEIGILLHVGNGDTLIIDEVKANSPAEEMGLMANDKIVFIGTAKVGTFKTTSNAYDLLSGVPGTNVEVGIVRGKSKTPINFPVTRRKDTWTVKSTTLVNNTNNQTNVDPGGQSNTSTDNGSNMGQQVTNTNTNTGTDYTTTTTRTTRNNNTDTDVGGFYISAMPGIGGASFVEPFLGIFEFEIGECFPGANTTVAAKFAVYHMPEADMALYSLKYSTTGYLGKYTKQGMFFGGDVGVAFFPRGDQPLWDFDFNLGYSFKVVNNLRIELVGSVNLMPTIAFTNVGIGGFGGVRIGGIF